MHILYYRTLVTLVTLSTLVLCYPLWRFLDEN